MNTLRILGRLRESVITVGWILLPKPPIYPKKEPEAHRLRLES